MQKYAIYLRKSRDDLAAERSGGEDTLARHEMMLTDLARQRGYLIGEIYREVVSGETISGRPEMQRLLRDVESERWAGVLVTEVTRLARGDTIDQGVVAQTFKYSGTLIVTPLKTYDPRDRGDEEYFEFGLFMSRREYQMINQRLQNGRIRAVAEGKYPANKAPYGYKVVSLPHQKGNTLAIIPEEARIVQEIYEWYTEGFTGVRLGITRIAHKLNELGVPTRSGRIWTCASIRDILQNPVYYGMIRWGGRKQVKKMRDGEVIRTRPRNAEPVIVKGLHEAIISKEQFDLAQQNFDSNRPAPIPRNRETQNPLAGLVWCGKCGRKMVRRPYQSGRIATLLCSVAECTNVSSDLNLVEQRVLDAISDILDEWTTLSSPTIDTSRIEKESEWLGKVERELEKLNKQLDAQRDLLEQGIYTVAEYVERKEKITDEISELTKQREEIAARIESAAAREQRKAVLVPHYRKLLEDYHTETPAGKNAILKEIVQKIVYTRDTGGRWCEDKQNFKLEVTLRVDQP